MKKIALVALCLASVSAYALPAYEPFTEYTTQVNANLTNAIDLCTLAPTLPSGDFWVSENYSGIDNATGQTKGLDILVTNVGAVSPFTATALGSLLPATFPGMPATGQAITIVALNPAQPGSTATTVGNSAVLQFASDITRPGSGSKTLYISYLISFATKGQLGAGNTGRYLSFLPSSYIAEPSGTYPTWNSLYNVFNNTTGPRYGGHGLLDISGTSSYLGAVDSSTGKDFTTSPYTVALTASGSTPAAASFVVGAYTFNSTGSDVNTVWVNPSTGSFGGPNPPTPPSGGAHTMAFNLADIGGIVLEDRALSGTSGGVPTNWMANLMVGTTWSYVTGGPEFTNQPANVSGTTGTVSVSAAATAAGQNVSYQWQHVTATTTNNLTNGTTNFGGVAAVTIVTNNNITTLTLAGLSAADAGSYQAVATASSTGYSLVSSTAVVTNDPIITVEPLSTTAPRGGTATFNISAATASPPLTFQWQLNGTNLYNGQVNGDGSTVTVVTNGGGNSSTLTISGFRAAEDGTIICGVTNNLNNGELSIGATAAVADPAITAQPQPVTINYGGTATFTTSVSTIHSPVTYAWYDSAGMLVSGTQGDSSVVSGAQGTNASSSFSTTLTVSGVSYLDDNNYYLVATNASSSTASSSSASLMVNDPYIMTEPPAIIEVPVGTTTTISVPSAGSSPTYQWSWTNGLGPNGSTGDLTGATTSAVQISSAQTNDSGTYSVVITGASSLSVTSSPTALIVETPVTAVTATPAVLSQPVATHLAFVATVTGGAPLVHLQWTKNGVNLANGTQSDGSWIANAAATMTGSGTTTLYMSNIQVLDSGSYELVASNANGAVSNTPAVQLTVTATPTALSTTNLVVLRVGEGSEPLSGTTGDTVYLDQFETNGSYVSSIMVPDNGGSTLIVPGAGSDGMNEGYMTLSSNGDYLNFAGYFQNYPSVSGVTGAGPSNPRSIGAVNGLGYYVLAYTNEGFYSGGSAFIRDVYSTDGLTNFWASGAAGSLAIKYGNAGPLGAGYANGTGVPGMSDAVNGPICLGLVGNNLVFSDNSATDTNGILGTSGGPPYLSRGLNIFSGAPQNNPANGGATNLISSTSPADFAFSPDQNTLYIADSGVIIAGGTSQGGGVQRWDLISGVYTYQYTLQDSTVASATNGVRGMVVYFPPNITSWGQTINGAVIFATTAETVTNRLIQFIDNGQSSTATVLATAGPNQFLRGVRFGPATVPVSIVVGPQGASTYTGQSDTLTVTAGGDGPFAYQWQLDGTNIANATNSSLALTNLQTSQSGTYTVIVSDAVSTNNSSAVVSVTAGPPTLVSSPQSLVETVGDHTAFTVNVIGTQPIYYQWATNGTNIPGATGSSLILTNIGLTNSATYTVVYSNTFGTNTNSATLLVTTSHQYLSSNNLVVARVGDGAQPLSDTTGNTLYLDQITPLGVYSNTIMIPDNDATSALIVAGGPVNGPNEAFLNLSANTNYLNFCGYDTNYPNQSSPAFKSSSPYVAGDVARSIAAVNPYGYYTRSQTNATLYAASPFGIYSVVSADGLNQYWATGDSTGNSVKYVIAAFGRTNGGNVGVTGSGAGSRVVDIVGGNVVYSDIALLPPGIYGVSGEPTTGATSNNIIADAAGLPNDFAASPDTTSFPPSSSSTVYVGDSSTIANGGGVQRYDWNGSAYVLSYTLGTGAGSTNGASGLTVDFSANPTWGSTATGAIIYATTAGAMSNSLIKIVDNGPGSVATVLAQANVNEILRGVRFGPVVQPLAFATNPASQSAVIGQEVDFTAAATGSGPITYQWALNGTNIPGATGSAFWITNVQTTNAGSYTVIASSPGGSLTNTPEADLTVVPFALTNSLVGWWQLNDGTGTTAADSSGYNNSGQLNNFPGDNSEWVAGLGGTNALDFANADNNGDNVVLVPDAPQLEFDSNLAFTLAAWVQNATNGQVQGATLVGKGLGNGGEQYTLDIYTNSGFAGLSNVYRLYVRNAAGTDIDLYSTNVPDTNGMWDHVAVSYDGYSGIMALYVNGVLSTNITTGPNSLLISSAPVNIGNRTSTATSPYDLPFLGDMQDVRIYNVALGPQNIQAIYQVLGVVPAPQIGVFTNTTPITNGSAVGFGSVPQYGTAPTITFTVTNSGSAALNLGTIAVPSGYTVTTNPPASIAAGASGSFSVQLGTATAGTFAGNVSFTNNSTNTPFTFAVTGTVTPAVAPVFAHPPITGQPGSPVLHFSGSAGVSYHVWTTTNLALQPVESKWTLVGAGTFSGGADTFPCPAGATSTQFYTITQP